VATVARKPRRPSGKTVVTSVVSDSGFTLKGGSNSLNAEYVVAAAEPFAEAARAYAGTIPSPTIEASISVKPDGEGAVVIADGAIARQAYAYENGLSHPLFGNRGFWYPTPKVPFMTAAARNKGAQQAAMDIYARQLDVIAAEYGYDE
jgi:hypothetical protein